MVEGSNLMDSALEFVIYNKRIYILHFPAVKGNQLQLVFFLQMVVPRLSLKYHTAKLIFFTQSSSPTLFSKVS